MTEPCNHLDSATTFLCSKCLANLRARVSELEGELEILMNDADRCINGGPPTRIPDSLLSQNTVQINAANIRESVKRARTALRGDSPEPEADGLKGAAARWLSESRVYWEAFAKHRQVSPAVVWLRGDDGSLAVYTRGEYAEQIVAAVPTEGTTPTHYFPTPDPTDWRGLCERLAGLLRRPLKQGRYEEWQDDVEAALADFDRAVGDSQCSDCRDGVPRNDRGEHYRWTGDKTAQTWPCSSPDSGGGE